MHPCIIDGRNDYINRSYSISMEAVRGIHNPNWNFPNCKCHDKLTCYLQRRPPQRRQIELRPAWNVRRT
eukprot:scaffold15419_cov57-Skeletonema_menzelii.AAC.1